MPADLPEHQQVALRLADVLLTQPADLPPGLREDLRRHWSDEQVLELTLDVMKWSYQKVAVALGTDAVVAANGLTDLAFDEEGRPVR